MQKSNKLPTHSQPSFFEFHCKWRKSENLLSVYSMYLNPVLLVISVDGNTNICHPYFVPTVLCRWLIISVDKTSNEWCFLLLEGISFTSITITHIFYCSDLRSWLGGPIGIGGGRVHYKEHLVHSSWPWPWPHNTLFWQYSHKIKDKYFNEGTPNKFKTQKPWVIKFMKTRILRREHSRFRTLRT